MNSLSQVEHNNLGEMHDIPIITSYLPQHASNSQPKRFLPRFFNSVATAYHIIIIMTSYAQVTYACFFRPCYVTDDVTDSWWQSFVVASLVTFAVVDVVVVATVALFSALTSSEELGELMPSVEVVDTGDYFYKNNSSGKISTYLINILLIIKEYEKQLSK